MPQTLIRKNPGNFKTLALHVEATCESLTYQGIGVPRNFAQTLQARKAIDIADSERFVVELANLGVSVRLTLEWQGREYWVLVRQRRQDRGDVVLKLISGYVPAHELKLPLLTALQEVAEECLLETPEGWLPGRYDKLSLATPYEGSLKYRQNTHFQLSSLSGSARSVHCATLRLLERPRAYVHLPTASLQLVYDLRMALPGGIQHLSLLHVDEHLEDGQLVARLDRSAPDLFLLPLEQGHPGDRLFNLIDGELQQTATDDLWLSESFAAQDGWLVREERIRWTDWRSQRRA